MQTKSLHFSLLSTESSCESHNRLENTQCDESDDACHHYEDDRLDHLLDTVDHDIHLIVIKVCDLDHGFTDLGCFFSDFEHLYEKVREEWVFFQTFSHLDTVAHVFTKQEDTFTIELISYCA